MCNDELNTVDKEYTYLWHKRLGYMSEKGLQILAKKDLIPGVKGIHSNQCVDCLVGKQYRISFHKKILYRKSDVLELVHSNICGPMTVKILGVHLTLSLS